MKPVVIDLCAGRGGWTTGFLAEGYRAYGFDIERHAGYPGELVLQDIRTIDGRRFSRAAVIVASPPCPEFSRWDQPWTRAKNPPYPDSAIELVQACWRIAAEAGAWLRPAGCAMVELDDEGAAATRGIFEREKWILEGVEKDCQGRERILIARPPPMLQDGQCQTMS